MTMSVNYSIDENKYGKEMILHSEWDGSLVDFMQHNNIKGLYLNYAKGWENHDLSFLKKLPFIESLKIIDLNIKDISYIHYLRNLKSLLIDTYDKTEIDFLKFPQLEECMFGWRPKAKTLFECNTLRLVSISNYTSKDTNEFAKLINLESLSIVNSPVADLQGLKNLNKLKFLGLYYLRKLNSLSGIEKLINLEELEINTCRQLTSIKEIGNLTNLKKLQLCNDGNIDTIKPLESLTELESFLFYESTNIQDGDLTPILKMKKLKKIAFQNRKHYTPQREEFAWVGRE